MLQNQPSQNFTMEQAMAFAASPDGQKLIRLMQQKGGADLRKAQALAAAGDIENAKVTLSSLLKDPYIQSLIKQMRG